MKKTILYIFSNGRVAAIDKKDGKIIWEIKLKELIGNSLSHAVGQINVEGDNIYIGVYGILICLSTKDGSLKWKNELKGWGYGFVSMGNVSNEAHAASIAATAAAASGAAAI
ncbi:MAG: PQQ-binding-like beta-propeller repeat protein [Rhizobacter sp.]|nr:PQQ-binding-like beta-propeller repeat protein [Ferruginibacter sp.]